MIKKVLILVLFSCVPFDNIVLSNEGSVEFNYHIFLSDRKDASRQFLAFMSSQSPERPIDYVFSDIPSSDATLLNYYFDNSKLKYINGTDHLDYKSKYMERYIDPLVYEIKKSRSEVSNPFVGFSIDSRVFLYFDVLKGLYHYSNKSEKTKLLVDSLLSTSFRYEKTELISVCNYFLDAFSDEKTRMEIFGNNYEESNILLNDISFGLKLLDSTLNKDSLQEILFRDRIDRIENYPHTAKNSSINIYALNIDLDLLSSIDSGKVNIYICKSDKVSQDEISKLIYTIGSTSNTTVDVVVW